METKIAFILEATERALTMEETEWKKWALVEGLKAGFTAEDLAEALFR